MDAIIKFLADYLLIIDVVLAGYLLLFRVLKKGRYDKYTRILMAGLTSYWLAKVIGNLWQPEQLRPFEQLHTAPLASYIGNAGFPSDHVLFATFLAFAVYYATRKSVWFVVMLLIAVAIAVGRVLALVHSPLDVIGGMAIAAVGALWYIARVKKIPHIALAKTANK